MALIVLLMIARRGFRKGWRVIEYGRLDVSWVLGYEFIRYFNASFHGPNDYRLDEDGPALFPSTPGPEYPRLEQRYDRGDRDTEPRLDLPKGFLPELWFSMRWSGKAMELSGLRTMCVI